MQCQALMIVEVGEYPRWRSRHQRTAFIVKWQWVTAGLSIVTHLMYRCHVP